VCPKYTADKKKPRGVDQQSWFKGLFNAKAGGEYKGTLSGWGGNRKGKRSMEAKGCI